MAGIIGPGAGAGTPNAATNPQVYFVNQVAAQTGLDPRVVYAWTVAEGAYAPNGTGGYDFLNLRPYPGDPYRGVSPGGFELFSSVTDAVAATVARIRQPFAQAITDAARNHASPAQQIAAIASTQWDAGHYAAGGIQGAKLSSIFAKIYGSAALGKTAETKPLPLAGGGKSGDQTKLDVGGWLGGLESLITSSGKLALAYVLLIGVAGALFVTGLKGLGVPTPKVPAVIPA